MRDEQIVELYWQRNEEAIAATEKQYAPYLWRIAYNILADREDSEESVNDTYLRAWNSIPPHRPAALCPYLARITRRVSIDRFRSRTRDKRQASEYALSLEELTDCVSGGETPEEALDVKLLAEAIGDFLRRQDDRARHAFIGRYYFLDSVKAVAEYCGISEANAKTILYRVRQELRAHLTKEGFDL